MRENRAIVAVGSNIEPEENVQAARAILKNEQKLLGVSEFELTAPRGYQNQPDFLNGALYVATNLDYEPFNQWLKQVEVRLGRVKGPLKSGPRTIDLDIIIWNGEIVHNDYPGAPYVQKYVDELIKKYNVQLLK